MWSRYYGWIFYLEYGSSCELELNLSTFQLLLFTRHRMILSFIFIKRFQILLYRYRVYVTNFGPNYIINEDIKIVFPILLDQMQIILEFIKMSKGSKGYCDNLFWITKSFFHFKHLYNRDIPRALMLYWANGKMERPWA